MKRFIIYLLPALLFVASATANGQPDSSKHTLQGFNVQKMKGKVCISWQSNAINSDHFEIERSYNGKDWVCVALVMGDFENAENNFTFTDKVKNSSAVYYRIKEKALTGTYAVTTAKAILNR